jgi:formylglycine-generating enzyme required for sulfatase activity
MVLSPNAIFAGRYRLLQHIGTGGFSVVWKAADQMAEDAIVAIKIYSPDKGMDEFGLKQFRKEYSIVLHLNHPGLLTARHFDIHEGHPYLVLPYCEGGSLHRRLLEHGPMTEREIAVFISQVAQSLAYLHNKDIIHQDIKPDNVLIDSEGNYLLTDFGISSRLRSTLRKSTNTGKALTVAYAPPERFIGKMEAGKEGDIFSLGVVIFELASGDVPWMGAGGVILKADSPLPELPEGYSKGLERWMQACLSYDPSQRPTAEQLKQAAAIYLESGTWPRVSYSPKAVAGTEKGRQTQIMPKKEPDKPKENEPQPIVPAKPTNMKPLPAIMLLLLAMISVWLLWQRGEEAEERAWQMAQNSNSMSSYETYLRDYPSGRYAAQARQELLSKLPAPIQKLINDMVYVQGGTFTMGCTSEQGGDCLEDEKPVHKVTLSNFYIGKFEVTQAQWRAVMNNNPSEFSGCDNCPVENVIWEEVQDFIRKLNQLTGQNFRLPTEAEWEYAARGGNKSKGYKYSGSDNLDSVAWYDDNSSSKTHPVGQKQANELGLYDMSGNVAECCSDWYRAYSSSSQTNPRGPSTGTFRLIRGGSWAYHAQDCRVSYRENGYLTLRHSSIGFRLARS